MACSQSFRCHFQSYVSSKLSILVSKTPCRKARSLDFSLLNRRLSSLRFCRPFYYLNIIKYSQYDIISIRLFAPFQIYNAQTEGGRIGNKLILTISCMWSVLPSSGGSNPGLIYRCELWKLSTKLWKSYYVPGPGTGLGSAIGGRLDNPNLLPSMLRNLE